MGKRIMEYLSSVSESRQAAVGRVQAPVGQRGGGWWVVRLSSGFEFVKAWGAGRRRQEPPPPGCRHRAASATGLPRGWQRPGVRGEERITGKEGSAAFKTKGGWH